MYSLVDPPAHLYSSFSIPLIVITWIERFLKQINVEQNNPHYLLATHSRKRTRAWQQRRRIRWHEATVEGEREQLVWTAMKRMRWSNETHCEIGWVFLLRMALYIWQDGGAFEFRLCVSCASWMLPAVAWQQRGSEWEGEREMWASAAAYKHTHGCTVPTGVQEVIQVSRNAEKSGRSRERDSVVEWVSARERERHWRGSY